MFDSFDNRVMLKGTLTAQTALRIGAGRATGVTGTDLPVVRDGLGKPYIPGSSFKGVLRSGVEALGRSLITHRKGACFPTDESKQCISRGAPRTEEGKRNKQEWRYPPGGVSPHERVGIKDLEVDLPPENSPQRDEELARRVQNESCLVCRVFGSPWLASKVNVRDLLVNESLWVGQFQVRNGVAIDRDTETAFAKKLYDFEVVPAGTQFDCAIVVENASDWELGLLMLGLRAFELGEATIGGASSRGLGLVKIEWNSRTRVTKRNLLDYLAGDGQPASFGESEVKAWVGKFKARLEGKDA
jgi:CRISPR-associated RAMP protein (TIGR02581 family)